MGIVRFGLVLLFLVLVPSIPGGAQKATPVLQAKDVSRAARLDISVAYILMDVEKNLSADFLVTSDKKPEISASEKWIKIDHKGSEEFHVTLTVKRNKREARAGTITISVPRLQRTVDVYQASSQPSLELSVKEITVGEESGSRTSFELVSNTAWAITGKPDWITISDEAGINRKEISLIASANPFAEKRTAILTVESPGLVPEIINITQSQALPLLAVSVESLTLNASGAKADVDLTSNSQWTIEISEPWLTASVRTGNGSARVVFTAADNYDQEHRSADITIKAGDNTVLIEVLQKAKHEE